MAKRAKRRYADMSLPPEERGRRRRSTPRANRRKSAQHDHATSPRAKRHARDGHRKMGGR
jgi:hypothetical protein